MNRKPPSRLPRRLLVGAAILLVALGAGHTLLWRMMAQQLESGWQAWVSLRRAQGWRVEHAPPVRGGWPLAATLTLDRVRLEGGEATLPGGLGFQAERLELRVAMPRLERLVVTLPRQQRLRLGRTEIPFTADLLVAVLPLEPGTPPSSADITAERLRIGTPAGGLEVRSASLTLEGSASATETEAALSLDLVARSLDLPPLPQGSAAARFGRRIETLSAELVVSGPLPPGRAPTVRAEAWRDGGGTLEVKSLALHWGAVTANAAATLALDETLQPMGAGTLRLQGAVELLDTLAEADVIGRRAAAAARTMVPLLSRPSAETGAPELEVSVTLEDRTLALARIPVARFAPLAWPETGSR